MAGETIEKKNQAVPPAHGGALPDISKCNCTRDKIDVFLNQMDENGLGRVYKAVKRIFLFG